MPPTEEKVAKLEVDFDDLSVDEMDGAELDQVQEKPDEESSQFALKMINSVKGINSG